VCACRFGVARSAIALDSTKIAANPSGMANRTYEQIAAEFLAEADAVDATEDQQFGEARGDELPPPLVDPVSRRAGLQEAKRQMEAEHQAATAIAQRGITGPITKAPATTPCAASSPATTGALSTVNDNKRSSRSSNR
jgi:hypothetical protein